MASGSNSGGPRDPNRKNNGLDGLRKLGDDIEPTRSSRRRSRSVANEEGLAGVGSPESRGSRRRKVSRRVRRRRVIAALCLVVVLLLAFFGGTWVYLQYRFGQISKVDVSATQATQSGEPFNIMLVGSDSRSGLTGKLAADAGTTTDVQGQRSDVVMIWHVDPATKKITIISIPRDTMVSAGPLAATVGTFNRINTAYGSGPNNMVKIIQNNFGIPINHVVQVNFSGFVGATNALGGVWLNFPYPARDAYSGLNIKTPGCQLVSGYQALATSRSRHYEYYANGYWHTDGSSDFGRIKRQDAFLKSLVTSAKSKYNPLTINAFLGSIPQGIKLDSRFSLNELVGLGVNFHSVNPDSISTETIPTMSNGNVAPWGSVLFVDEPAAQELLVSVFGNQLMKPKTPPPNPSLQTPQPPVVTTTTMAPTPTTSKTSKTTTPAPVATTTTTTPAPSFDPVPCSPK